MKLSKSIKLIQFNLQKILISFKDNKKLCLPELKISNPKVIYQIYCKLDKNEVMLKVMFIRRLINVMF